MGQYTKELMQRLRDNRDVRLSTKAREVRKAASKRDRERQQAMTLEQNSYTATTPVTGGVWTRQRRRAAERRASGYRMVRLGLPVQLSAS